MALNQLMRIGKHAIKLHNMIDDAAEMESWVAKKIDLAGDYVKKVYNYTEGEKAGLYDDGGMTEIKKMPKGTGTMYGVKEDAHDDWSTDKVKEFGDDLIKVSKGQEPSDLLNIDDLEDGWAGADQDSRDQMADTIGAQLMNVLVGYLQFGAGQKPSAEDVKDAQEVVNNSEFKKAYNSTESVSEDAGEGHMSKSTLYHTAKYAIALMDMIKPGDDLEGWVQSKLNKAADYLQGVYNYEEYQKLNPYREELDASLMRKHAQVVQKNIDEILSKETKLDDIDTKPGMMRILAKRVNEVEKEIAKETRKKTNEDGHTDVPSAIRNCETIIEDAMQMKQKLQTMEGELPSWMTQMIAVAASDLNDARDYLLNPTTESGILYRAGVKKYGKAGMKAIQSAAGKGATHQEIGKIKDKHLKDEENIDESVKDWARNLAAAGVIVGAVAGMGSIQNAIDNTVPAVKAMNTAYEMAMDAGNKDLAKNIKKDISAVKVRLDSGRDLDFVRSMQEKYAKFIQTEGLAYESRLQVQLNQQLK
jgi:hypothetical protein